MFVLFLSLREELLSGLVTYHQKKLYNVSSCMHIYGNRAAFVAAKVVGVMEVDGRQQIEIYCELRRRQLRQHST
jgi:hypothetical protein